MDAFRCSHCSKVTISIEGNRCSHCDNNETREFSIPENPAVIDVRSNAGSNNFLHMQNIFLGTDCSIPPRATDECNSVKLHASEEKDTKAIDANGSNFPSSQEREKSIVYSFAKGGINFNLLKHNQRKDHFSELCSKNGNSTVYNKFLDSVKIIKESSEDVFRKGCINNDLNEKLVIKGIKSLNLTKLFPCNKCVKAFTDESKLKVHLGKHSKKKSFTCDRCDKKYVSEARLIKHYKSHTDKRSFKCNLWDLVFTKNSHLSQYRKKHILKPTVESSAGQKKVDKSQQREQETNGDGDPQKHFQTSAQAKIFPCTECGAKFIRESDFKAHSLRHSVQKPFKCNKCNKEFRYEFELNKHYRVHALKRPFICKICGFSATHGSIINRHLKWCQVHS